MPFQRANGVDLYYERTGTGRPIVFLHGVLMGARFFERQQNDLADAYDPIVLDFRGHGRSAQPQTGHTLPTYADDLEAFLAAQGLSEVVLVGWSMGALVGWEYVDRHGTDRLDGFVVVDQQPADLERPDYDYGVFDLAELTHVLELAQTDHHQLAEVFLEDMFHTALSADQRRRLFDEIAQVPPLIKTAILFDQSIRDYREVLSAVDVPTLVVTGRDDALVDPDGVAVVAEKTPEARLEYFEASSHCPFIEEPEQFADVLRSFVEEL